MKALSFIVLMVVFVLLGTDTALSCGYESTTITINCGRLICG